MLNIWVPRTVISEENAAFQLCLEGIFPLSPPPLYIHAGVCLLPNVVLAFSLEHSKHWTKRHLFSSLILNLFFFLNDLIQFHTWYILFQNKTTITFPNLNNNYFGIGFHSWKCFSDPQRESRQALDAALFQKPAH